MGNPCDDLASVLEKITSRIDQLESRISILEHHSDGLGHRLPPSAPVPESHPLARLAPARSQGAGQAVGKIFLGIAGGYLLRALAESGVLPRLVMVLLALMYATGWLVWAARAASHARFTSTASAITAALIFSPMMWEVTLRFKALPDGDSAAVLVVFVALAFALAWERNLTSVAWIATSFSGATALLLLVATRDPAPFACALLVMALLTEIARLRGRWPGLQPVVALLADAAILVLTLVYSQAQIPPEYTPVRPAVLLSLVSGLFAIYGTGIVLSTLVQQQRIGGFQIGQAVLAFSLLVINELRITRDGAAAQMGLLCFLLAGACYLAVFTRFATPSQARNYHVFAAWGVALVVMGSFLLFHAPAIALCLSTLAVVATFCGFRFGRWVLGFHGALYLGTAIYVSGLWDYAAGSLAGPWPPPSGWSVWTALLAAFICGVVVWLDQDCNKPWVPILLRFFFSCLATYAAAALVVAGILWVFSRGVGPSAPALAVIRTLVLCIAVLALSFTGSRRNHAELVWIAYTTIAFCTLKLLFEDLRHGTAGSFATSLFLYGAIWVLVPRLLRTGTRTS